VAHTYSTYEAKAKFSEVMRKVRAGQRIVIAYHGEEIAEIRPK
jgi:prevent-host-death family protein